MRRRDRMYESDVGGCCVRRKYLNWFALPKAVAEEDEEDASEQNSSDTQKKSLR